MRFMMNQPTPEQREQAAEAFKKLFEKYTRKGN